MQFFAVGDSLLADCATNICQFFLRNVDGYRTFVFQIKSRKNPFTRVLTFDHLEFKVKVSAVACLSLLHLRFDDHRFIMIFRYYIVLCALLAYIDLFCVKT